MSSSDSRLPLRFASFQCQGDHDRGTQRRVWGLVHPQWEHSRFYRLHLHRKFPPSGMPRPRPKLHPELKGLLRGNGLQIGDDVGPFAGLRDTLKGQRHRRIGDIALGSAIHLSRFCSFHTKFSSASFFIPAEYMA